MTPLAPIAVWPASYKTSTTGVLEVLGVFFLIVDNEVNQEVSSRWGLFASPAQSCCFWSWKAVYTKARLS